MRRLAAFGVLVAACGSGVTPALSGQDEAPTVTAGVSVTTSTAVSQSTFPDPAPGVCADVIDVDVEVQANGDYRFDVTVASADTGWDKYADAWEVRAPDGTVLGVRELAHPHVDEQPFTRSLSGVTIAAGMTEVVVAARDSVEGFCGVEYPVPIG